MKKTLAILLSVAMIIALLVACGPSPDSQENNSNENEDKVSTENGDMSSKVSVDSTVNENVMTDSSYGDISTSADSTQKTKITVACTTFESLAPWTTKGSNMQSISYSIYETLWGREYGSDEEIGIIAKEWEWVDDYTVDVTIYDYIHDVNGNPITADDVVFSFEQWVNAGTNSFTKYVDSTEKIGDYEVSIKFTVKPYPSFLQSLTCYIVSQKAYEESPDGMVTAPIGTGHYKVTEFVNSSKVVCEKTFDHWQTNEEAVPNYLKANVDIVEFDVISETSQVQTALSTGAIQEGTINASIAENFEGNDSINVVTYPGSYIHSILFNLYEGSVFSDNLALRQAVLYAIDSDAIAYAVTYGTGYAPKGLGDPAMVGYQTKWLEEDYYEYDVDKAKELLAEAGYQPGELTLKWCGATAETQVTCAQVIQACLADIGINLEISTYDQTTYLNNRTSVNTGIWDLCYADLVPNGYVAVSLRTPLDNQSYEWGNQLGMKDDTLQDLLYTTIYDMSDDNIDMLYRYVTDNALLYSTYTSYSFYGVNSNIETLIIGPTMSVAPNAFIFNSDYSIYG